MNLARLFRRHPTPHEAAATLSRLGHEQQRERYRATARALRERMGLPADRRLA